MLAISSIAGLAVASRAQAETTYTPQLSLSERYDSNVWGGPKEFVPTGRQRWDFVTTARAGVELNNKNRLGDSFFSGGVSGSGYADNKELSFVSTDVFASTDLSRWSEEVVRGLQLQISEKLLYTPESPAFLTGGQSGPNEDIFIRGVQGARANTFKNILSAQATYSLSRLVGFRTDYSYSIFRRGQIQASLPGDSQVRYFDTTTNNVAMGPTYQFGEGDTVFFRYNYVSSEGKPVSGPGTSRDYQAHIFQPEYVSRELQGWTVTISGGATVVESFGSRTFFSGKVALETKADERTSMRVSLSRQATPSFFGTTAGALISNLAQASVSHGFSPLLRLTVNGGYSYGETTPISTFTTKSRLASAALEYRITPSTVLSLLQDYQWFDYTGAPAFDRYTTMLMWRTEWR